ncbi:MAG: hypothetical protein IT290_12640 [Deltaproteobacteria bacterium]|nr:hypothetical protein [Deltaproteobacteria bacterium]
MGKNSHSLQVVAQEIPADQAFGNGGSLFLDIVNLVSVTAGDKRRIERIVDQTCRGANIVGVVPTERGWDIRPIVVAPNSSDTQSLSIIRFFGPEISLVPDLNAMVKDAFARLSSAPCPPATLIEAGNLEGQHWYRRALVTETLKERISDSRDLSFQEALQVACGLIRAVGNLHDRGLIHGHISPSNSCIGAKGEVILLDPVSSLALVQASVMLDMPDLVEAYDPATFAPECFSGNWPNGAADIYGIGKTLWEIFSRVRRGEERTGDLSAMSNEDLRSIRQRILSMTAEDVHVRPSIEEALAFFVAFLNRPPTPAPQPVINEARSSAPQPRVEKRPQAAPLMPRGGARPAPTREISKEVTQDAARPTAPRPTPAPAQKSPEQRNPVLSEEPRARAPERNGVERREIRNNDLQSKEPVQRAPRLGNSSTSGSEVRTNGVHPVAGAPKPPTPASSENRAIPVAVDSSATSRSAQRSDSTGTGTFAVKGRIVRSGGDRPSPNPEPKTELRPIPTQSIPTQSLKSSTAQKVPSRESIGEVFFTAEEPAVAEKTTATRPPWELEETDALDTMDLETMDLETDSELEQAAGQPQNGIHHFPDSIPEITVEDAVPPSHRAEDLRVQSFQPKPIERQKKTAPTPVPQAPVEDDRSWMEETVEPTLDFASENTSPEEETETIESEPGQTPLTARIPKWVPLVLGLVAFGVVWSMFSPTFGGGSSMSEDELQAAWSSAIPSQMAEVAEAAIDPSKRSPLAEAMIVGSALRADRPSEVLGGGASLLRTAFDKRWEMELRPEDRRAAIRFGTVALLGEKAFQKNDGTPIESLHPGVIYALTATLQESGEAILKGVPAEVLSKLPSPIGLAFGELARANPKQSVSSPAVRMLTRFSLAPGANDELLHQFLAEDTNARLRAVALLAATDEALATKLLETMFLHANLKFTGEVFTWARISKILAWEELRGNDQLLAISGIAPAKGIAENHIPWLRGHPYKEMRRYGMEQTLSRIKLGHPGGFEILSALKDAPEALSASQTFDLAWVLQNPKNVTAAQARKWLSSDLPVPLLERMVVTASEHPTSNTVDLEVSNYLQARTWEPSPEVLQHLTMSPQKFFRFLGFSRVFKLADKALAQQILQGALEREKDPEFKTQLQSMVRLLQTS